MASLAHYGIKGMKWGVRRAETVRVGRNEITSKNGRIKRVELAEKTKRQNTSAKDASVAAVLKKKAKTKSVDSMSNDELKKLVTRMNLEKQYNDLARQDMTKMQKFANDILQREGKKHAERIAADFITKKVAGAMGGK